MLFNRLNTAPIMMMAIRFWEPVPMQRTYRFWANAVEMGTSVFSMNRPMGFFFVSVMGKFLLLS